MQETSQVAWPNGAPTVRSTLISREKERGLVAVRDMSEDEPIFDERPWVAAQYLYNADFFPVCGECMKSLETPPRMLQRLAGLHELPTLPLLDEFAAEAGVETAADGGPILCGHCRTERYCSGKCLETAWVAHHALLCPAVAAVRSPAAAEGLAKLVDVWKSFHYPPETATPMLLLRAVARVILAASASGSSAEAPLAAFKTNLGSEDVPARFLEAEFSERFDSLYEAFYQVFSGTRAPEALISRQEFHRLFSAMCLNAQGFGTSALDAYERFLTRHGSSDAAAAFEAIDALQPAIEDISGGFTAAEGSAFYQMHRLLNHACAPNAMVTFPDNSAVLRLVALRPIRAGDEVTIAYRDFEGECGCDESEGSDAGAGSSTVQPSGMPGVVERREYLRAHYQFECECEQCVAEGGLVGLGVCD